jgi:hypothetical protein
MFDINLKSEFVPYESNEDFLIETILARAFESGDAKPTTSKPCRY